MMKQYVVTFFWTILFSACVTAPRTECGLDAGTASALRSLLAADWKRMTPEATAKLWPSSIQWGSETSGDTDCAGTATFSHLARVVANTCECCDTFGFSDVRRGESCERVLSSITVVRQAPDEARARQVASELLVAAGHAREELVIPVTSATKQLSATEIEVLRLEVVNLGAGRLIRLLIYRASDDDMRKRGGSARFGGPEMSRSMG